MINALDYPNFLLTPTTDDQRIEKMRRGSHLGSGQYAIAYEDGNATYVVRDPIGCNPLFYGQSQDGNLVLTNRIHQALELGVHLDNLSSCPPGHVVRIDAQGAEVIGGEDLSSFPVNANFDLDTFHTAVAQRLDQTFSNLNDWVGSRTAVICLSGGLDSSAIASLAKQHLENVIAVSFSYLSEADATDWAKGAPLSSLHSLSDDFQSAIKVAEALGIPFAPAFGTRGDVLTSAAHVVRLGQDWRDFNVHCATVNLLLAQNIRAMFPDGNAVVLTGDLMNEYVCDYREENIDGTAYYPQPRMAANKRRRFFIRGLDAGDRELGVFNAYGLPTIQPFAHVADLYMSVPNTVLEQGDVKEQLNSHLLDSRILGLINAAKQRAQVGGTDGGTLGIFHRFGLTSQTLADLWSDGLPQDMAGDGPHDIIHFGRYRTTPRQP